MSQTILQKLSDSSGLHLFFSSAFGLLGFMFVLFYINSKFSAIMDVVSVKGAPDIHIAPPTIEMPDTAQLIDIASSRDSWDTSDIETKGLDDDLTDTRYERWVGDITDIKYNPITDTFLVQTSKGYVLGSIPSTTPIRIGERIRLRQDYSGKNYHTWICPEESKLCSVISN